MKSLTKSLSLLALAITVSSNMGAQEQNLKLERLHEIYREKTAITRQNSDPAFAQTKKATTAGSTERALSGGISTGEAETFIAINPTNSNNLVASFMSESNTLEFPIYYTNNAGLTWTKSSFNVRNQLQADLPGHIIGGGGDPVFTYDKNGKCYFSWIYLSLKSMTNTDTAYMNMFWAYSTDGGQTWQVENNHKIGGGALLLSGGGVSGIAEIGEGILDRQWMAADRSGGPYDGNIYASTYFVAHASGGAFIDDGMTLSRKSANSNSFQLVSYAGKGSTQFGNIEVDQQNGNIHITYCDLITNQLLHTVSSDGGNTFSTPVTITTGNAFFPSVGSRVHSRENAAPNLAIDGSGNLHIVWSDFIGSDYKSYYSTSSDGGATWSTPKLIDNLINGGKAFMPTVSASGDKVSISCYSIITAKKSTFKSVSSMDNGTTFLPARTISGDTTDFQMFPSFSFFGDYNKSVMEGCNLYSSWSDGRLGYPIVYVAKTDACEVVGLKEVSPLNTDISIGAPYPQPAGDLVHLPVNSSSPGSVEITLMDLKGSRLMSAQKDFKVGLETTLTLALPELQAGTYLLMLKTDKGLVFTRKVVVD